MPITRNENKETDLIIGNNFPVDNEETFAADAATQRAIAENLRHLTEKVTETEKIVTENMSGQTATQYANTLATQAQTLTTAAETHDTLAHGLETTANNIAVSKANMNSIDDDFHANMDHLQQWGKESGEYQEHMNEERTKLVDEAQENIRKTETTLSSFQSEAASTLSSGKPLGTYDAFKLREGATSTPLIDSKGAGYSAPSNTPAAGVLSQQRAAYATANTTPARYTSPRGTTLSSTAPTVASSGRASKGFEVPAGLSAAKPVGQQSAAGSSSAASSTTAVTPAMGGMMGGALASMAGAARGGGAGLAPGASSTPGATGTGTGTRGASTNRGEGRGHREGKISPDWSEKKREVLLVAVTLWQNLAACGWDNPVAVARVRDDQGAESFVWATNFAAAFVPDRVTVENASPIDVSRVDVDVARKLVRLPASMALHTWLQHTGVEVSDRVVIAPKSDRVAPGFDRVDFSELFSISEDEFMTQANYSSDVFVRGEVANPRSEAERLAAKATNSLGEALQYATYAQASDGETVMADGSSLSQVDYVLQAVYATLKLKLDAGDEEGYAYLVWQAEQLRK